jgi:hypothetical protein
MWKAARKKRLCASAATVLQLWRTEISCATLTKVTEMKKIKHAAVK